MCGDIREAVENARKLITRYADSGIGHGEREPWLAIFHRCDGFAGDSTFGRRVFVGVADEVIVDESQFRLISRECLCGIDFFLELELHVLLGHEILEVLADIVCEFSHIARCIFELHFPGIDAREVEEVVHQIQERLAALVDVFQELLLSRIDGTAASLEQDIGISADDGHGRAELMGCHVHENIFFFIEGFEFLV